MSTNGKERGKRSRSTRRRGLLVVGLLLGFALRLYQLGAQSLWYDETVSVYLARQSIPELIAHTARDIHPPGYYLLLHVWQTLTQPTPIHGLEFLYTWPSLFAGMLLLPLIYALGRKLFDPALALIALWLTAVHPYHLWYSQEVRMYTVAAFLGLLCLWSVVKWTSDFRLQTADRRPQTQFAHLAIYVIAAAAGLYTLYYFAFLLIALNLLVMFFIFRSYHSPISDGQRPAFHDHEIGALHHSQSPVPSPQSPIPWLVAQLAVIVLWLPWLPIFWRQMTEPPVPPWRGDMEALTVLRETLAGALVGQSPPLNDLPWAGIALILLLAALPGYAKFYQPTVTLFVYTFAPMLLIYLISIWVTPLYHIRYFFTYAAPLPLLLALGLRTLSRGRRPLMAGGLAFMFAASAWGLAEFWTNPLYRADDHRAAVMDLATAWRPGDVILVNAGWVYPALEIYWPQDLDSVVDSLPPSLSKRTRLLDYTKIYDWDQPTLLTTGSVDGSPSLGWGLAESDFYAMKIDEAQTALTDLSQSRPRVWHYRLYDTVSDPGGDLRTMLEKRGDLLWDQPYPGRDYLRLQLYESAEERFCPHASAGIDFGDALRLFHADAPTTTPAGSYLYTTLCWQALEGVAASPDGLRTSLRLYRAGPDGETMLAQADTGPLRPTTTWTPGHVYREPLALPISAAMPPGTYNLALIVYNGGNGEPLPPDDPAAVDGQRWQLGTVKVEPPSP
ncbi:MAG: glycosyltransferase family 39 protein [Caldilineaceae bacterium]|nr:glycosyltransferase family 39 protein [Caldilineaceae bacterium]